MSKHNNRLILVGKAGSGKSTLAKRLEQRGFLSFLSLTTRPPRTNEIPGVDYAFISIDEMVKLIRTNALFEHKVFNGWHYGTTKSDWETKSVFIFTPSGVTDIPAEDRRDCFVIYIDIDLEIRKERLLLRSDADSVDRRIASDEKDFADFDSTKYDMRITNCDF